MDQKRLQQIKQRLLSRRKEMEKLIDSLNKGGLEDSLRESTGELSLYDNHPGDLGAESFERGKDLALKDNARIQINKIDDSLERIAVGEYGLCERCGRPIPEERLEALPESTLCLECRREEEGKGDRHPRPLEEDVLRPPFGGVAPVEGGDYLGDNQEEVMFDDEDAWQEVARYGSSDTPSDLAFSGRYPDVYADWQEDRSAVEEVDAIPYEVDDDGTIFKSSKGATQPGKKPQH